jgi:hypothetical protein
MSFLPKPEQTTLDYGIAILGMYRAFHLCGDEPDRVLSFIFRFPLV